MVYEEHLRTGFLGHLRRGVYCGGGEMVVTVGEIIAEAVKSGQITRDRGYRILRSYGMYPWKAWEIIDG